MCVHGATGIQDQFPNDVPKISSSLTMMKMAAKSGHRGERSRKYANTGRQSAPCTSTRPVTIGSTVTPARKPAGLRGFVLLAGAPLGERPALGSPSGPVPGDALLLQEGEGVRGGLLDLDVG